MTRQLHPRVIKKSRNILDSPIPPQLGSEMCGSVESCYHFLSKQELVTV